MEIQIHKVDRIKLETNRFEAGGGTGAFMTHKIRITDLDGVETTVTLFAAGTLNIEGVFNDE